MNNDKGEEMDTTQSENEKWDKPNLVKDNQGVWVPKTDYAHPISNGGQWAREAFSESSSVGQDKPLNLPLDFTVVGLSQALYSVRHHLEMLRTKKVESQDRMGRAALIVSNEQAINQAIWREMTNATVAIDKIKKVQKIVTDMTLAEGEAQK